MTDEIYHGSATIIEGKRVSLTPDEAKAIWESWERNQVRLETAMPDSLTALAALNDVKHRLNQLGWRDGIYCPKDGTEFAIITFGSTGIFSGHYSGTWPDGDVNCGDWNHDVGELLWKDFGNLSDAERERLDQCTRDEKAAMERQLKSFAVMQGDET